MNTWGNEIFILKKVYKTTQENFFYLLRYSIEKQSFTKSIVLNSLMNHNNLDNLEVNILGEMCHWNGDRLSNYKANCSLLILLIYSFIAWGCK